MSEQTRENLMRNHCVVPLQSMLHENSLYSMYIRLCLMETESDIDMILQMMNHISNICRNLTKVK